MKKYLHLPASASYDETFIPFKEINCIQVSGKKLKIFQRGDDSASFILDDLTIYNIEDIKKQILDYWESL